MPAPGPPRATCAQSRRRAPSPAPCARRGGARRHLPPRARLPCAGPGPARRRSAPGAAHRAARRHTGQRGLQQRRGGVPLRGCQRRRTRAGPEAQTAHRPAAPIQLVRGRDEACPVSTRGGTRLVQLVREGRGSARGRGGRTAISWSSRAARASSPPRRARSASRARVRCPRCRSQRGDSAEARSVAMSAAAAGAVLPSMAWWSSPARSAAMQRA